MKMNWSICWCLPAFLLTYSFLQAADARLSQALDKLEQQVNLQWETRTSSGRGGPFGRENVTEGRRVEGGGYLGFYLGVTAALGVL